MSLTIYLGNDLCSFGEERKPKVTNKYSDHQITSARIVAPEFRHFDLRDFIPPLPRPKLIRNKIIRNEEIRSTYSINVYFNFVQLQLLFVRPASIRHRKHPCYAMQVYVHLSKWCDLKLCKLYKYIIIVVGSYALPRIS